MALAKCFSAQLVGLDIAVISVEVDISVGLNAISIVGLGDRAVEEAKDRISAAIKNSGFTSPKQKNQKVVVSLAPADVRKEGASFDLAMAVSYLIASGEVKGGSDRILYIGELSLEGKLSKVSGILPILIQASRLGFHAVFIPKQNAKEASLSHDITIYAVEDLQSVVGFLAGRLRLTPVAPAEYGSSLHDDVFDTDISHIRGNEIAKRGLLIAAAGAHNILLYGPPGTGKTMLAKSLISIMPSLSFEESVEVTSIHSAAKVLDDDFVRQPPFRAPHHTASHPAIVGGGSTPRPGEITLAHNGILFLDEFPEFSRSVLEALRQPLEERCITIARAKNLVTYPAKCILIASMNPCPCGKHGGSGCVCSAAAISSYRRRISGPIMDRFDLWINVNKVDYEKLSSKNVSTETSRDLKQKVIAARAIQKGRFHNNNIYKSHNSELSASDIDNLADMTDASRELLRNAASNLDLSARGFHRVIKVARTIADIEQTKQIEKPHILEALQYRQKLAD